MTKLPAYVTDAIGEHERTVADYERGPSYLHPLKEQQESLAELLAAIERYAQEYRLAANEADQQAAIKFIEDQKTTFLKPRDIPESEFPIG